MANYRAIDGELRVRRNYCGAKQTKIEKQLKKTKPITLTFTLDLPKHYRAEEILGFHARDPAQLAERITDNSILKAVVINGHPTLIDVSLHAEAAHCTVQTGSKNFSLALAKSITSGLLGLTIPSEKFEQKMQKNSLLGPLIKLQRGLCIPQAATPFEALTWAIIGQQINLRFAIQLRHTFIALAKIVYPNEHPSGLMCYPDATAVCKLSSEQLGTHKFSRAKAETLIRVANQVVDGTLPLDQWQQNAHPADEIEAALLNIKGIGPWTAHYTLMRGFGVADCSLHGDVAVRKALARLRGDDTAPTIKQAQTMLAEFAPYRSLAAAHLWASLHVSA
jgi:DNA-3-methyladenine glycosylase II